MAKRHPIRFAQGRLNRRFFASLRMTSWGWRLWWLRMTSLEEGELIGLRFYTWAGGGVGFRECGVIFGI